MVGELGFPSRLVLVKHSLSSISIYLFSVFRAPEYFAKLVCSIIISSCGEKVMVVEYVGRGGLIYVSLWVLVGWG